MNYVFRKAAITIMITTVCSLCWAELKRTNFESSEVVEASAQKKLYAPEQLIQRSGTCESSKPSATITQIRTARKAITDSTNSQKLLLSYAHLQKQVMMLRSLGAKNIFDRQVGRASKKTMRACSTSQPGNLFNKSLLNLGQISKSEPEPPSRAQQTLQKRYLLASVEAARLDLQIKDGPFSRSEKQAMKKQRARILAAYPMAVQRYPNTHDLEELIGFSGKLYRSRQTYSRIDDFLFNGTPLEALLLDASSSPVAKLANRLISRDLPPKIAEKMNTSMAASLAKPLRAIGEFCSLSPCHQMGIDRKATADVLSGMPASEQVYGEIAVCNCKLKGGNPSFMPTLAATMAVGGTVTGVLCFLAPPFCPGAVMTLAGATGTAAWSASETAAALYSDLTYADVLKDLPAATAGEWERLNNKNSEHLTELFETAVIGAAGGKAAQLALNKIVKHLPFDRRANPRDLVPEDRIRADDIEQTVNADGKPEYFLKSGNRRTQIRTDVTGYVIAANNDEGRELFSQVLNSGHQTAVMIDVNNLSLINYFDEGSKVGDQYLAAVAKIIAEKSKSLGVPSRWGGDEFVVSLDTTDTKEIMDFQKSIIDGVAESKLAQQIFSNQRRSKSKAFKEVQAANSYDELPENFKKILTENERKYAQENFGCFLQSHLAVEKKGFCDLSALSPSVSIGSSRISADKVEEAIGYADAKAAESKIDLKSRQGQPVKKYTGRESYVPDEASGGPTQRRDIKARTKSLPPETPPNYKPEKFEVEKSKNTINI